MKAPRRSHVAVAGLGRLDPPTDGDRRRIRAARRAARSQSERIEAVREAAVLDGFRAELGAAVRSASPLLIALLAMEGMTLDEAVATLAPKPAWPLRPRLAGAKGGHPSHGHMLRYYMATRPPRFTMKPPAQITQHPLVSRRFGRSGGGHMTLQVVDHSLEVEAEMGPAHIETRFGEVSLELECNLPATILAASVGRPLEAIVDHEAWRGLGWRITGADDEEFPWGQRLTALTGAVEYRMPWAR